ncbi:unnamed protein product [Rotaria socialis]|uniref:Uncharacterized protein n=1 Tax=Rotaria socialis TaxID=392032 RepID=A0A817SAS4_9BILA|nr:unnamed protein product [Rotaria socialis]CAF4552754.1 unnamed protein product [Rotaria socialis]
MINKDRISRISKSISLESLHSQPTTGTSILSSTKISLYFLKESNKNNRRKTLLLTPHRTKSVHILLANNQQKESYIQESIKVVKNNTSKSPEKNIVHMNMEDNNDFHLKISNSAINIDSTRRAESSSPIEDTNKSNREYVVDEANDQHLIAATYKKNEYNK